MITSYLLPLLSILSLALACMWAAAPGLTAASRMKRCAATVALWAAVGVTYVRDHPLAAEAIAPAVALGFAGFVVVRALTRTVREVRAEWRDNPELAPIPASKRDSSPGDR
ncbi:MAG TPA: hypothetical protein VFK85_01280 [Anaeromyxobacteraceae bacterium]|nr:hypothetical protein [Anaeromyxobacteraceae bacterium]